jgi:hypothetical protein
MRNPVVLGQDHLDGVQAGSQHGGIRTIRERQRIKYAQHGGQRIGFGGGRVQVREQELLGDQLGNESVDETTRDDRETLSELLGQFNYPDGPRGSIKGSKYRRCRPDLHAFRCALGRSAWPVCEDEMLALMDGEVVRDYR